MPRSAEEILEFGKLRELLRGRSTCAPGKRALDALAFSQDRAGLERGFALIREAREWLRAGKELGFGALADPEGWLAKIEGPGTVLEISDFLDAASLLDTASWLRLQFRDSEDKFPLLAARAELIIDFRDVLGLIRRAIMPTGEISDDASPELRKIRANILQTRDSIQKSLKQILRSRNAEAGEDYVTLRNDRFVIPIRSEQRRSLQGIVHGASGTGQTVFVEPLETVEANNQLVQFSEEEAAEIFRILRGLTERLRMVRGPLVSAVDIIAELDSTFARSAQCGVPVTAQHARLPLFDSVLVDIGDEQSIAADLSTFSSHMLNLKSILSAATPDSLVLADEMGTGTAPEEGAALAVALLDEFRARESFVLATTHHDRLKAWASTAPGVVNAAVEFDEVNLRPTYRLMVGVPGGSSGIAIARRLGLAAEIVDRARTLLAPESREAADLIAYLHRSREELDRMRRQMAADRRALEEDREKLRTEWVDRQQKRIRELEAQFAEMHKRFEENVARVVEAVKERELRASLEKSSRRKLQEIRGEAREELNAALVQAISESQLDLSVSAAASGAVDVHALGNGARIRVRGFARPVIFRRLDGSSAEVEAGPLRMKVALDEIVGIEQPPAPAETPRRGNISFATASSRAGVNFSSALASESSSVRSFASGKTASGEISVIGLTVEQATELVDKFLDDAALAHLPSVRIIHGHGTGALRRGLGDFLESHPLVAAHSFESDERGGKAVTVVQLRP